MPSTNTHRGLTQGAQVEALLAGATFTPIHAEWLGAREERLAAWLASMPALRRARVLLLNATKGLRFFPSVVSFFALLQRVHPGARVASASYFDEIFELGEGAARQGLEVVSTPQVMSWSATELSRFDLVLAVGPSDALARLVTAPPFATRLVCLDLGFYHQLIDAHGPAFLKGNDAPPPPHVVEHRNAVVCYSCQPRRKIEGDLRNVGLLPRPRSWRPHWLEDGAARWRWRWFPYIPIGFAHHVAVRGDRVLFDVALLGTSGRSYDDVDPAAFRGRRILFIGREEGDASIAKLRAQLPVTVVTNVDEDDYARLLAVCRCVVLPARRPGTNVYLSVVDALAAGKPLVTARLPAIARLRREGAPLVLYSPVFDGVCVEARSRARLGATVRRLLSDEGVLRGIGERAIAFARDRLDLYRLLSAVVQDELVPAMESTSPIRAVRG
jgi:hypothetical protein